MRAKLISATFLIWTFTAFAFVASGELRAQAADLKFDAQLLWGTNEKESPNPKHKAVDDPDIKKKLAGLPFKWANYFVVNRTNFAVASKGTVRVRLSEKCEIQVKDLGNSKIEVTHFGKGNEVWKGAQVLGKGDVFPVLGGNAPNSTGWMMVLKR